MLSSSRKILLVLVLLAMLVGSAFTTVSPARAAADAQQDDGRITVLLLGADTRPRYRTERPRTDSIMLLM
ncbi:MAG TPA: hypothetical protein PK801_12895, partial [Aggregatilineales bacterium]|nr:hypothetical protein [Aggregatilineales bacterium]HQE20135.1 hypothetical protein [Aggregatilineales bacterium]